MNKQRRISTTLIILLIVLLAVIVGGVVVYKYCLTPEEAQDGTAGWEDYRSIEYGFEIKHPEGWSISRGVGGYSVSKYTTRICYFNISSSVLVTTTMIEIFKDSFDKVELSLENWISQFVKSKQIDEFSLNKIEIGKEKGLKLTYYSSEESYKHEIIYFSKWGFIYVISLSNSQQSPEQNKLINKIISTFNFLDYTNPSVVKSATEFLTDWCYYYKQTGCYYQIYSSFENKFSLRYPTMSNNVIQPQAHVDLQNKNLQFSVKSYPRYYFHLWLNKKPVNSSAIKISESKIEIDGIEVEKYLFEIPAEGKRFYHLEFSKYEKDFTIEYPETLLQSFSELVLSTFNFITPLPSSPDDWVAYENEKYSYQVDYPRFWKIIENKEIIGSIDKYSEEKVLYNISFQTSKRPAGCYGGASLVQAGMDIDIYITENSRGRTLEYFKNGFRKRCSKEMEADGWCEGQEIMIDGVPAFYEVNEGICGHLPIVNMVRGNKIYRMSDTYSSDVPSSYEEGGADKIFDQFLSTFRFLE